MSEIYGMRWCEWRGRTMRAGFDGRVMVVGRRAAAAHAILAASARSKRWCPRAPAETRPQTTPNSHTPLLPRGRLGMGRSSRSDYRANVGSRIASGRCDNCRRGGETIWARVSDASRWEKLLTILVTQSKKTFLIST